MWAWTSADDWEQSFEHDRIEAERLAEIRRFQQSVKGQALNEDYVDVTPVPIAEAEPVYASAKKTVIKTKKRIKRAVKKN